MKPFQFLGETDLAHQISWPSEGTEFMGQVAKMIEENYGMTHQGTSYF